MKRKNLKPMIISALLAVGFGATSVGTSFALFTDHADTNISVTAGKVDVDFSLASLTKTSADADASVKTMTDENEAQYGEQAGWVNGGDATFNPTTGFLDLDRMTPGDKVTFGASFRNNSNVAIKYRLVIQAEDTSDYLIKGLNFKVGETSIKALKTYKSAWTVLAAPTGEYEDVALGTFAIELPITAGNAFQNLSTSYNIGIEAVQANALTEEGEEIIAGDLSIVNNVSGAKRFKLIDEFRDEVNNGETYEGWTVKLNDDVDLDGVNWVPIGTDAHPFSGAFDGNNKTISNFTIDSTTLDTGLFGVIRGVDSADFKRTAEALWDADNVDLYQNADSIAPFGTYVKNLTISNVNISSTKDYVGALAGYALDTYFSNIDVKNAQIYAKGGKAGGVIGSSNGCTILNDLTTDSYTTVTSSKHSFGGIVGNVQRGYDNGDHTIVDRSAYQNKHAVLIENCVNGAYLEWDKDSPSTSQPVGGIVGNAGSKTGLNVVVYKCVNNGDIYTLGCGTAAGIVGQSHEPTRIIYQCINNGDISAEAVDAVAGITYGGSGLVIQCSNTGTLTNRKSGGAVYDVTSSGGSIVLQNETYANVAALQADINGRYSSGCTSITLRNVTVSDKTGALTLPSTVQSISSNTKVCDSVVLTDTIQNINMIGLNQSISGANLKALVFGGQNNALFVPENGTANNIHLAGTNITFTNNGTMGIFSYGGSGNTLTATNNGTMNGFSAIDTTANMTFTNNGTVTRSSGHTFDIECGGNLVIHNYGDIVKENVSDGIYALLFYNQCNVDFYAHAGSTVTGAFAPYSTQHVVNIYYAEGTTINGNAWTSVASEQYHVNVYSL